MFYQILSLVFFAAAIAIGCVFKKNTGVVSIALALILGFIASTPDPNDWKVRYLTITKVSGGVEKTETVEYVKFILNSFDSSLFLMLLGVMFLFCIAENNRTLELIAKKSIRLCGGKVKLIPVVLFGLGTVISAVGPGLISTTALMAVLAMALAVETNVEPIKFLLFGGLGAFAGGLSPITPSAIVAIEKSAQSGFSGIEFPIAFYMFVIMLFCALVLYFFVFRWHRYKEDANVKISIASTGDDKFKIKHIATLIGIVVTATVSTIFDIKIGLVAFVVALILTLCGFADEGAALKKLPWNTLLMITGVGILISLVSGLGGIKLLQDGMSFLMGDFTAAAIITILAGVMSWFSSASGVVMPTLIPTVAGLQGNPIALIVGICIGANAAAFSPLSSCGGLMLAAYSGSEVATTEGKNKMFAHLFFFSAACILVAALFALTGCFGLFSN